MIGRLLAFALLLTIGGGVGWHVYERERGRTSEDGALNEPEQATDAGRTDERAERSGAEALSHLAAPDVAADASQREAGEDKPTAAPEATAPPTATADADAPPGPDEPASTGVDSQARIEGSSTPRALPTLGLDMIKESLALLLGSRDDLSKDALPSPAGLEHEEHEVPIVLYPLEADPPVIKPSFDVVQIGRDRRAVIAGRAEPGAEVDIRAGERVIDQVVASSRGQWVSMPPEPLRAGERELSLAARIKGGEPIDSEQVLVVALPEPPGALPEPTAIATGDAADAASQTPQEPVAVLMRKDGGGPGRVLQAPGKISTSRGLALMVLDYDEAGKIRLSGEAEPGVPVRIYVDNRAAGVVVVPPSGKWQSVLGERLEPGDYTLRLDQLDPDGRPVARLETPFTRARELPVRGRMQVDYVVVQPGNSLWRIAHRLFGEGFQYVHIFDANRSQIRDPDLIYPGQVFEIPADMSAHG